MTILDLEWQSLYQWGSVLLVNKGPGALLIIIKQRISTNMIFKAMNADKWLWPIFGCKVGQSVPIGMKLKLDV